MNVNKDFKNIAPRVGVTYQLDPRTVIRSGYGRSFDLGVFGTIFGHVVTQNLPVLANQNLTNSGANTAAFNLSTGPAPFVFPAIPSNGQIPIPNGVSAKVRGNPQLLAHRGCMEFEHPAATDQFRVRDTCLRRQQGQPYVCRRRTDG